MRLVFEGNRCRKNVTKFRPLRAGSAADGSDVGQTPVSVIVHNDPASRYKYLLKPLNDPPQIRVVVPGTLNRLGIFYSRYALLFLKILRNRHRLLQAFLRSLADQRYTFTDRPRTRHIRHDERRKQFTERRAQWCGSVV